MQKKANSYHISSCIARVILLLALAGASCAPHRKIPKNQHLLIKNRIEQTGNEKIDEKQLQTIFKQKPNRKFLGFYRLYLQMWNLGEGKKDSRLGHWLKESVGEPPVVLDTSLVRTSKNQINRFLFQEGYFHSKVSSDIKYRGKKKAIVNYKINPGEPFYVSGIKTIVHDNVIEEIVKKNSKKSLLKEGEQYRYLKLKKERERITRVIKNAGYFDFNKSFVRFEVDTISTQKNNVKLTVNIINPQNDSIHTKFYLRNTFVYPEYDYFSSVEYQDTLKQDWLTIMYNDPLNVSPKLLRSNIYFDSKNYSVDNYDKTYRRLVNLNMYDYVNVEMVKDKQGDNYLDAYIYLTPALRHSFLAESRLETRGYTGNNEDANLPLNLGLSGSFSFTKNNAFKNGELLRLGFSAGLEPFFLSDSSFSNQFFNTMQIGPSFDLIMPRFWGPIGLSKYSKKQQPQTKISLSYNLLKNDDLLRRYATLGFSYRWRQGEQIRNNITIAEISVVNAQLSSRLSRKIDELGDPFLKNSYSNQMILASSYTFSYSTLRNQKKWRFSYRGKFETSGNLARMLGPTLWNSTTNDGSYQIFNTPFAQYILQEQDFRAYKHEAGRKNHLAMRFYQGIGKPFKNLETLPFEKSFFAGGANGVRAWRVRSLGPGSYFDTTFSSGLINQIGEIKLEANIEYRFKIIGFFHGAFFTDVGNIWMLNEQGERRGTEFSSAFWKQLAVGSGFGFRVDFDFFIVRFDTGVQLHDPALPDGERWVFQKKSRYNKIVENHNKRVALSGGENYVSNYKPKVNFSIGIGYPF